MLKLQVLCAVLLGPAVALAAEPAAAPPTVSVRPQLLRLAEGGRAVVRVASSEEPLITVSVGRVERVREASSGVFEAEYVPPDALDPQVVVITAVTRQGFAWTSLLLAGVREVEVKAPHRTLVSATVHGQVYGPIPADATGRAVVRVDVPPGVYVATSQGKTIDLGVARNAFSHVALDRATLEAETDGTVVVRAIALSDGGEPLKHPTMKLEVSDGAVSAAREIAPGVVEARWTVKSGPVRESSVKARLSGRPGSTARVATAVLRRVAGAPAAVRVEAERDQLVAGEVDELAVTARVVDAAGNTTDSPAKLLVSMVTGANSTFLPDAVIDWQQTAGVYSGRIQVPRQRAGKQQIELKVIGPNALVGTRLIHLVAGPPVEVKVEPEEDLYADGRSRQLRVVLLDKYGNRTEAGGAAEVTATRGTVGAPTQSSSGVYVVAYRSPLSATDYRDVIRARIGPLEGLTQLRVRARGGTVVIGVKGGYTAGTGSLSSPTGGVEVGFWRPSFHTSLGLVLDARYYSFGADQTLSSGSVSLPVASNANFLAFDVSLAWRRPMVGGMFWLGAGPGFVHQSSTVSAPGQPDLTSSSWEPSAHASVGWGPPFGPGIPFAEVKGGWQAGASEGAVTGSVATVTLNVGYRFDVL